MKMLNTAGVLVSAVCGLMASGMAYGQQTSCAIPAAPSNCGTSAAAASWEACPMPSLADCRYSHDLDCQENNQELCAQHTQCVTGKYAALCTAKLSLAASKPLSAAAAPEVPSAGGATSGKSNAATTAASILGRAHNVVAHGVSGSGGGSSSSSNVSCATPRIPPGCSRDASDAAFNSCAAPALASCGPVDPACGTNNNNACSTYFNCIKAAYQAKCSAPATVGSLSSSGRAAAAVAGVNKATTGKAATSIGQVQQGPSHASVGTVRGVAASRGVAAAVAAQGVAASSSATAGHCPPGQVPNKSHTGCVKQ